MKTLLILLLFSFSLSGFAPKGHSYAAEFYQDKKAGRDGSELSKEMLDRDKAVASGVVSGLTGALDTIGDGLELAIDSSKYGIARLKDDKQEMKESLENMKLDAAALVIPGLSAGVAKKGAKVVNKVKNVGKASKSPWIPNLDNLWKNKKEGKHFKKHGKEFGVKTKDEYTKKALEFGTRDNLGNLLEAVVTEKNGAKFFYRMDPESKIIFIGNAGKNKMIQTFHKFKGKSKVVDYFKNNGNLPKDWK